ncbi:MAG: class I SAM-dependent methyltransferase, partial [Promicromonosporaceae bacterium]|nr:class I SAM-dependent methyltransferase [Promicromonosporaceae bacterium]
MTILKPRSRWLARIDFLHLASSTAAPLVVGAVTAALTRNCGATGALLALLAGSHIVLLVLVDRRTRLAIERLVRQQSELSKSRIAESVDSSNRLAKQMDKQAKIHEDSHAALALEMSELGARMEVATRELGVKMEVTMRESTAAVRETIKETANHTDKNLRSRHTELLNEIQALLQLLDRFQAVAALPTVDGWAMTPSGLLALIDLIEQLQPECIVECGSGTSTLWMAMALKKSGKGKLIALEHDKSFANKTQALLSDHGLSEWAEVRLAPLRLVQTPLGEQPWYTFDVAELTNRIQIL